MSTTSKMYSDLMQEKVKIDDALIACSKQRHNIEQQLTEAQEENDQLKARIARLEEFIEEAPVSSGVCCCGEDMESHPSPYNCGHTPVDEWGYAVMRLLEESPRQSLDHIRREAITSLADKINAEWVAAYGGEHVSDEPALLKRIALLAEDRRCWIDLIIVVGFIVFSGLVGLIVAKSF